MKEKSSSQKTSQHNHLDAKPLPAAGPDGLAVEPPVYTVGSILPVQRKADPATSGERQGRHAANRTGLPDGLKAGVEELSGLSMDDVRVHTNSSKPAQLQALAYTQGTDIHVAPGQECHIPHEAWHVVQQKQGRVEATMQMKGGIPVNDDNGLEHEADVMGAKARALQPHNDYVVQKKSTDHSAGCGCSSCAGDRRTGLIQRKINIDGQEQFNQVEKRLILVTALEHDNKIPGTLNELITAIDEMITDNVKREGIEAVIAGLKEKMVDNGYGDLKNVANIPLRAQFPHKTFSHTDSAESMEAFTHNEVLGNNLPNELGYVSHPQTGKILGVGLGQARVVQPHEIGSDETAVNWGGSILTHSHPSGSPHTIPNDITVAVDYGASKSRVITRNFIFTVDVDHTNNEIQKYKEQDDLADLKLAVGKSDREGQDAWGEKAYQEGFNHLVYNPNNRMNPQENEILQEEFKKTGLKPNKWTMSNDYAVAKFMGYQKMREDFASKGLAVTGPTEEEFLAHREKFYTGVKKKNYAPPKNNQQKQKKNFSMLI